MADEKKPAQSSAGSIQNPAPPPAPPSDNKPEQEAVGTPPAVESIPELAHPQAPAEPVQGGKDMIVTSTRLGVLGTTIQLSAEDAEAAKAAGYAADPPELPKPEPEKPKG